MVKVLISDKLSPAAIAIFKDRGVEVDVKTGLTPAELRAIVGEYDGLAIRSATKVTKEVLDAATNLKVVGRAGIGVDNVDVKSATSRGVVVMNTPVRQCNYDRGTCHCADVRPGPAIAGGERFHQSRQVGKKSIHGRGADGKSAGADRLREYRLHRRGPRRRAENEGAGV